VALLTQIQKRERKSVVVVVVAKNLNNARSFYDNTDLHNMLNK